MMTTVEKIGNPEEFEKLKAEWNKLLEKNESKNIFLTFEWLYCWWKIYGRDKELYLLAVREGPEIVGLAPLMRSTIRKLGRKRKIIQFIGTPNVDYCDFIGADKELIVRQIVGYLKDHKSEWDVVELSQISDRSGTLPVIEKILNESGRPHLKKEIETCYGYIYNGLDDERANFSYHRGATLKKAVNRFNREGGLRLERITDPAEIERTLPQFFKLHINRWRETGSPSKFLQEENRRFFIELVRTLGPLGEVCFFVLKSGELPVAMVFNFEYGKVINHYTIAINVYFRDRSPGILLLLQQSEYLIRRGYDLDFSRGAHQYKTLLTNREYINYQVAVFKNNRARLQRKLYDRLKATTPIQSLLKNEKFMIFKSRIVEFIRRDGLAGLLGRLIKKSLRIIIDYRVFNFYTYLGDAEFSFKPEVEVECRKLGKEDIGRLATLYGIDPDSPKYATILGRLEQNDDCFGAFHNEYLVSVTWGLHHNDIYPDAGLVVTPEKGQVISSDALTLPVYRGKGIRPFLMTYALKEYKSRGLKILGAVERSNKTQLRSIKKLNYTYLYCVRKLRLFGIRVL
jgi:CelD/BcsL family acetyltransferase involved in cellulose biosynthesis/GNAT superfamily N-acetyltransferase